MKYIKYKKCLSVLILIMCVTLTQVYAQESFIDTVKKSLDYIQIDKNTISNKLYPINNNKQVYFFGSYGFFTINKESDIIQVKKQLNRDKLLVLLKNDKILIASNYIDSHTQCTNISEKTAKLLEYYPEKIKTSADNIFLIGNNISEISCYRNNEILYLPNNEVSRIDLQYIVKNTDRIESKIFDLQSKSLKEIYHYVTNGTSYDYDALDYDSNVFTPYLASSFFEGKKIVCDGYSKTFAMLAPLSHITQPIIRIKGSRQSIDKKDEKSFLHSWVKIGEKYYDPTFDDNDDNQQKTNYYGKSKKCFNLDHYTAGRKKFSTHEERIEYTKYYASELLQECPEIVSQTILKDDGIQDFVGYILSNSEKNLIKKFMCQSYQICGLQAKTRENLAQELRQYTIQYNEKKVPLKNIILTTGTTKDTKNKIDSQTKKILDEIIRKIKIRIFFYNDDQRKRTAKNIKLNIIRILKDPKIPQHIKDAMKYISKNLDI